MNPIQITIEITPNPNAIKFLVNQNLVEEYYECRDAQKAQHQSTLAYKLLSLPWIVNVFIGTNFITITKEEWVEWEPVKEPLIQMMKQSIASDAPVVRFQNNQSSKSLSSSSAIVEKIKFIIDNDIQPAVRRDGGFIQFSKFKEGKLYVELKGACSGCPSAEFTLKQGIEQLIRQEVPEVQEVISI